MLPSDRLSTPRSHIAAPGLAALAAVALLTTSSPAQVGAPGPLPPAATTASLAWGDLDGDAFLDALVLATDGALALHRNLGDGTFSEVGDLAGLDLLPPAAHVLFEDVDGDGLADVFVGRASGGALLLRNVGSAFTEVSGPAGLPVAGVVLGAHVVDYDADGRLDLHVVTDRENIMLHAVGRGGFEAVALASVGDSPMGGGLGGGLVAPGGGDGDAAIGTGPGAEGDGAGSSAGLRPGPAPLADGPQAPPGAQPLIPTGGTLDVRPGGPAGGPRGEEALGQAPAIGCFASIADAASSGCLQASSVPSLGMLYPLSEDLFVDVNGFVGLGTTSPRAELHVDGSGWFTEYPGAGLGNGAGKGVRVWYSGTSDVGAIFAYDYDGGGAQDLALQGPGGRVGIGTNDPSAQLHVTDGGSGTADLELSGPGTEIRLNRSGNGASSLVEFQTGGIVDWIAGVRSNTSDFMLGRSYSVANADLLIDQGTGNVGIGTASPVTGLHVGGTADTSPTDHGLFVAGEVDGANLSLDGNEIMARDNGAASVLHINREGGTVTLNGLGAGLVGIGTTAPTERLDVNGAIRIRGGADIVESFESSCGVLEPGTVVAIDPDHPGQLMCARDAYDTKVAGVVSGAGGVNPGLMLGQDAMFSGETKVAMTGRVYVRCTTESGPVRPGDRLTTSSLAGHAMKVLDDARAPGTVIGKAMSSLDDGTGLVLVLVNLQ